MSDYHILDSAEKKNGVRVAFHVAVPDTNNQVGTSWRTALTQWRPNRTSVVPGLDHQADLDSGAIIEEVHLVEYSALATDQQKLVAVEAYYTAHKTALLNRLQNILRYWGRAGNVA